MKTLQSPLPRDALCTSSLQQDLPASLRPVWFRQKVHQPSVCGASGPETESGAPHPREGHIFVTAAEYVVSIIVFWYLFSLCNSFYFFAEQWCKIWRLDCFGFFFSCCVLTCFVLCQMVILDCFLNKIKKEERNIWNNRFVWPLHNVSPVT